MKRNKKQEIREESVEKLNARVLDLRKKLISETMPRLGKEASNVKIASVIKKEIAVILTIIGERSRKQSA